MRFLALALSALFIAAPAYAQDGNITIDRASAMPAAKEMPSASVFLIITNNGDKDDKLIGVSSEASETAILRVIDVNDKKMIAAKDLSAIPVPAHGTVPLTPVSDNILLGKLKNGLKLGDSFPLTLTFEKAGAKQVTVNVIEPQELLKRFPPELTPDRLVKLREDMQQDDKNATWADRLRKKIQAIGRGGPPAPSEISVNTHLAPGKVVTTTKPEGVDAPAGSPAVIRSSPLMSSMPGVRNVAPPAPAPVSPVPVPQGEPAKPAAAEPAPTATPDAK